MKNAIIIKSRIDIVGILTLISRYKAMIDSTSGRKIESNTGCTVFDFGKVPSLSKSLPQTDSRPLLDTRVVGTRQFSQQMSLFSFGSTIVIPYLFELKDFQQINE